MITKKCLFCEKEFRTYPYNIKIGKGKYCSQSCAAKMRIPWNKNKKLHYSVWIKGKHHTKLVKRKISQGLKQAYGMGKSFGFQKGKKHFNWKGGKIQSGGYIFIHQPNHPFVKNKTYKKLYIPEHRLIAEKCLNRYLLPKERIHHINEIKNDNRPENLYLFSSRKEHDQHHKYKNLPKLTSNLI